MVTFGWGTERCNTFYSKLYARYILTKNKQRPCTCSEVINPRRAYAARVTVVVLCVCVCRLSVSSYSHTTGYEAARDRYQRLHNYASLKNYKAILLKRLRPRTRDWHGRVADRVAWPNPSISCAHAYLYRRSKCEARLTAIATPTRSARSVYLEGTISRNEGRV